MKLVFKLYSGQLDKLFNLGHIKVDSLSLVFVYFKGTPKIRTIKFKSALFKFICKYVYKLSLNCIVFCPSINEAQALAHQSEKASGELDKRISECILDLINNEIEAAPKVNFDIVPSETEGVYYLKSNESSM